MIVDSIHSTVYHLEGLPDPLPLCSASFITAVD